MPIKIGNISTTLIEDSGSACFIILNRSVLLQVVKSSSHDFWVHDNKNPQLRTFSNELIRIEGKVQAPVSSKGWTSHSATFTVAADGLKSLIDRDLFDQLRQAVTQSSSSSGNQVNTISPYSEFKEYIALTFPILISRIGLSKNHVAKSKFHKTLNQDTRRVNVYP